MNCCECGRNFRPSEVYWYDGGLKGRFALCSSDCKERFIDCQEGKKKINSHPANCCNCGRGVRPSDKYCMECGTEFCDKVKAGKSDLENENRELKNQLAEVQKQLTEVLEELKKLRNSSAGQNNKELDQQINYNEKLIRHVEEVPETEIKEQVQKSQELLKDAAVNATVSPNKNKENGAGPLPYVVGGSVILASAGIIGYYLLKKNKRK